MMNIELKLYIFCLNDSFRKEMQISKFEDLYGKIDANAKPIDRQAVESVLQYIVRNEKCKLFDFYANSIKNL